MRQSLGVDVSVVVLYTGRQCNKFFGRTGIHTMTIDLNGRVTL